jgi:hypothetical protein
MPQKPIRDGHHLQILIQHRPVPLPGRQPHHKRPHPLIPPISCWADCTSTSHEHDTHGEPPHHQQEHPVRTTSCNRTRNPGKGLRRQEACGLDLADLRRNPKAPEFGRLGALFVRYGKASRGAAPKRRTVLTVPEMDWVVAVLEQWLEEVRPLLDPQGHPALWVTERRGRLSRHCANEAFALARDAAGLAPELDLHCLRHSFITHLVEFDYPERFVSDQAGHAYAATTAIYTGVSDEYRTRLLVRALADHQQELGMDDTAKGRS